MRPNRFINYLLLLSFLISPCISYAEHAAARENSIKAAYLYNLLKFIEWPNNRIENSHNIEVCSFSDSAINNQLQAITARKAKGRTISIRIVDTDSPIPPSCFLLFITNKNNELDSVIQLKNKENSAILTVGENEAFVLNKGHVALVHEQDHVQLQINIKHVKHCRFKVNGKLLEIAKIIK